MPASPCGARSPRCYAASGALTAVGALFFAARLGTVGGDIGVGLEVTALTAAVLGGIASAAAAARSPKPWSAP